MYCQHENVCRRPAVFSLFDSDANRAGNTCAQHLSAVLLANFNEQLIDGGEREALMVTPFLANGSAW